MPPRPAPSSYAGAAGLLLAVEVVSRGSEVADRVVKKTEYAKAGIARYWVVERDAVTTVHRHVLDRAIGEYVADGVAQPVAWLLTTVPNVS